MLSMGMGQLLMTSCPNEPPADPLGRLAAATERITVMLFAVKTTSSALQGVTIRSPTIRKQRSTRSRASSSGAPVGSRAARKHPRYADDGGAGMWHISRPR
jgi:hypothetical protein